MPKSLEFFVGKTIVITGAASGIGRATAQIFAREGANVVCGDIDAEGAERTANQIIQKGGKSLGLACDVTKREQIDAMIKRAIAEFGRVNFQFNSAGAAGRRCARALCAEQRDVSAKQKKTTFFAKKFEIR